MCTMSFKKIHKFAHSSSRCQVEIFRYYSVGPAVLDQSVCFVSAEQTADPNEKTCSYTAVNLWSSCQGNCVIVFVLAYLLTFVIYQEVILLLTPCS